MISVDISSQNTASIPEILTSLLRRLLWERIWSRCWDLGRLRRVKMRAVLLFGLGRAVGVWVVTVQLLDSNAEIF